MIEQTLKFECFQLRHPVERWVFVKSVLVQLELTGRYRVTCKETVNGPGVKISQFLLILKPVCSKSVSFIFSLVYTIIENIVLPDSLLLKRDTVQDTDLLPDVKTDLIDLFNNSDAILNRDALWSIQGKNHHVNAAIVRGIRRTGKILR